MTSPSSTAAAGLIPPLRATLKLHPVLDAARMGMFYPAQAGHVEGMSSSWSICRWRRSIPHRRATLKARHSTGAGVGGPFHPTPAGYVEAL